MNYQWFKNTIKSCSCLSLASIVALCTFRTSNTDRIPTELTPVETTVIVVPRPVQSLSRFYNRFVHEHYITQDQEKEDKKPALIGPHRGYVLPTLQDNLYPHLRGLSLKARQQLDHLDRKPQYSFVRNQYTRQRMRHLNRHLNPRQNKMDEIDELELAEQLHEEEDLIYRCMIALDLMQKAIIENDRAVTQMQRISKPGVIVDSTQQNSITRRLHQTTQQRHFVSLRLRRASDFLYY